MRIIEFLAENVKKLKVVEIKPTGDVVQITGKNGQGKTSVLDSIWWALGGSKNVDEVPIHTGTVAARIRLDLGDLIVERKFGKGEGLSVRNKDGARLSSPQDVLDSLIGRMSFDPLAFSRMDPKAQFIELCRVAELSVDLEALDAANKQDYKDRESLNREAKAKRSQAAGIVVPDGLPDSPPDESAALTELQDAATHNTQIVQRRARREETQREANDKKAESERISREAKAAYEAALVRAESIKQSGIALQKQIDEAAPLPEPIDISELRVKIESAKSIGQAIRERNRRTEIEAEATGLEHKSKSLTDAMASREKQKANAIASAKLPVDGLGFGSGVVMFKSLPLSQASDRDRLMVGCGIAMAQNPKIRVIRIRDGSLIDEDGMQLLADMAKDKDFQIWIERVDSSGKIGVFLEDGEVKS